MTSAALFIGSLLLLFVEGWCLASLVIARSDRMLALSLSLPLASLVNVLVFFLFTVLGIPLFTIRLVAAHVLVIVLLLAAKRFLLSPTALTAIPNDLKIGKKWKRILTVLCMLILGCAFLYAFAHAALLPTFQYDSLTNWIMRSKMSFLEHRIIFDNSAPHEAIRKPFYPVLLHALHLMGNLGQSSWNDSMATGMVFLVSMSLLTSAFLLLHKLIGSFLSLLTLTLIVGIPLFAIHLGEGYADHLLAEFGVAALVAFALAERTRSKWLLVLSALMASAAVWTKAEGLFFVLLPWVLLVCVSLWGRWREMLLPLLFAAIISIPWPLFLLAHHYGFTPHGSSDTHLGYQAGSLGAIVSVLLWGGSFGVFWPLRIAAIAALVWGLRRRFPFHTFPLFLPGLVCFFIVIFIYTFTPNVEYLLNGESFDRQLLTPAALLVIPLMLSLCLSKEQ